MGNSNWRKVKAALNLTTHSTSSYSCLSVPKTREHSDADAGGGGSNSSPPKSSTSSFILRRNKTQSGYLSSSSSSSLSKKSCAICLEVLKSGHGQAIFSAECSHTFHFHCITANVRHGNTICPICRSEWKEVPFQKPVSEVSDTKVSGLVVPQNNQTVITPNIAAPIRYGYGTLLPSRRSVERSVFDDDEQVAGSNERGSSFPDGVGSSLVKSIEVKMHPEVSAIARSSVHDNFNVLIHLKAPDTSNLFERVGQALDSQNARVPVDIVTVLDVSGSMAGTKIALLEQAMGFVIQNLGPSDRLSVVTFSSSSIRLFPLIHMTDEGKQKALEKLNSLTCGGGTNIAHGLRKGAKVIMDRKWKNPVVSIILLSDGQDTYGHGEYQTLLPDDANGNRDRSLQIPVHTFGFGADHDADLMHSIAENSGGTFSFIESENAIQDAFAQCIGGLLSVVVQDLKVEVECIHPSLRLNSIKAGSYRINITNESRRGTIHVGDLYADEERNFLVFINIPVDQSSHETPLLKLRYACKDMTTNNLVSIESACEVKIQRPEKVRKPEISLEVDRQRNRLHAAEAMAEAKAAAETGNFSRAVSVLDSCQKALEGSLSAKSGDKLCPDICSELKEMQERMSSRQRYESSGRGYILSGLSSHQWQRATTCGDSSQGGSLIYQTRTMTDMVTISQSIRHTSPPHNQKHQAAKTSKSGLSPK